MIYWVKLSYMIDGIVMNYILKRKILSFDNKQCMLKKSVIDIKKINTLNKLMTI